LANISTAAVLWQSEALDYDTVRPILQIRYDYISSAINAKGFFANAIPIRPPHFGGKAHKLADRCHAGAQSAVLYCREAEAKGAMMKFSACPACGGRNTPERRCCVRCGTSLVPVKGQAVAIAAGAFVGALVGALLWFAILLEPFWPYLASAVLSLEPLGEMLYLGTSVIGMMAGMLLGAVTADYLNALSQGVKGISWGAALTPLLTFLATLGLAVGVIINFEFLPILVLPFIAPPVAVFVVLYAQRRSWGRW
jgi:hypothetical protein